MTPRFSVSDFLAVLNQSLEVSFGVVEVVGEVASFKVNQQKFVFFDLKDAGGTVGCFMTVWQLRVPIEDGMKVSVRATAKVTNWGKFSLTVQEIRPVGKGSLKRSIELLRSKLEKEGLFDAGRKRSLPAFPVRVAVVSSQQAAGYADFMKIAEERWGGATILVAQTQVQGASAPDQIIRAFEKLNQLPELPEVIVLIRGGGSADDLSVFNDEMLVRAVAASRVPVLTGIGHEVDESLCDLAADLRASTPSNAAQILFPDKHEVLRRLRINLQNISGVVLREADVRRARVRDDTVRALEGWRQSIDNTIDVIRSRKQMIKAYNPATVLNQGYAIVSGNKKVGELITIATRSEKMKARIVEYERRQND